MTPQINVNYTVLENNGRVIYVAPAPIAAHFVLGDRVLILYDSTKLIPRMPNEWTRAPEPSPEVVKIINSNVLCLDFDGKILWQLYTHATTPHHYSGLWQDVAGDWMLEVAGRWIYELDVVTGNKTMRMTPVLEAREP